MIPNVAFLSNSIYSCTTLAVKKYPTVKLAITPREIYDIVSVSTFGAFFFAQYDQYSNEIYKRPDVEVFADIMAIAWYVMSKTDVTIFPILWIIGAISYTISYASLSVGNENAFNEFHAGVHLGGQMSLVLLLLNLLTPH